MEIENKINKIFTSLDYAIIELNSYNQIINYTNNIKKIIKISHKDLKNQPIETILKNKKNKKLINFLNKNKITDSSILLKSLNNETLILNISYDYKNDSKKILI